MAHILLLEDDHILASQLGLVLSEGGHTVCYAQNVQEAIHFFESEKIELIITDLFIRKDGVIEQAGGISFMRHVRVRLNDRTPIIAISGSFTKLDITYGTGQHFEEISRGSGAQVILAKPFDPDELLKTVADLVESR